MQIREYNIIYNLTNDIRSALEGKLKPREEVVHLGRAVVRETFKISRVGTIAGCYVTQGIIERSAKVRVIRDGVVIYPPPIAPPDWNRSNASRRTSAKSAKASSAASRSPATTTSRSATSSRPTASNRCNGPCNASGKPAAQRPAWT